MSSLTHYAENKIVDWRFRGQVLTLPANWYVGFFSAMPSKAGGGTEFTGGAYVRQPIPADLADWAGTQAAGSTAVSSGTSATTSNNVEIVFPTPTDDWGTAVGIGLFDAESGGNLWDFAAITPKIISSGDDVRIPAGQLTVQVDNT
jgi:hypothetical protein